jgi:hypothetical protein
MLRQEPARRETPGSSAVPVEDFSRGLEQIRAHNVGLLANGIEEHAWSGDERGRDIQHVLHR